MKRKVLSIFILSANLLNLTAQNMTNSPASMFGLGELSTGEGGIYSGMGGVGIALRGENAYNSANPASLTGLMPQYFFFDLGVSGAYALLISCGKGFRWELTFLMWVVLLRNRRVREVLRKQTVRINIQCMLILDYSILMR